MVQNGKYWWLPYRRSNQIKKRYRNAPEIWSEDVIITLNIKSVLISKTKPTPKDTHTLPLSPKLLAF